MFHSELVTVQIEKLENYQYGININEFMAHTDAVCKNM